MTYKEYLFASSVDSLILNESFNYPGKINFLDLLLEAPIDDSTVKKMIADKKRVSIYYQGDKQSPKGWYSIEAVKVKDKGGDKYLLTYVHPKEGGEPKLTYFIQERIVNWNILGKKDASSAKEYDKKIVTYFKDPKIPIDKKKTYAQKLKKLGVNVLNILKKGAVNTAFVAALASPFHKQIDQAARKAYPQVVQMMSPRDLSTSDFTESQVKMLGHVIFNAIERTGKAEVGGTEYKDYKDSAVSRAIANSDFFTPEALLKQAGRDPKILLATTLGRFTYTKNADGSYTVTDDYDFRKGTSAKTTKKDIEGMNYLSAIRKIMKDDNLGTYLAVRHYAYLANPDNQSKDTVKKIKVEVPAEYITAEIENDGTD